MRIFVTGATGYIGSSLTRALRDAGHEVGALVRPDADTKALRDQGVVLLAGELQSLPSLREQLAAYDAFVHAAQSRTDTVAADRAAVDTFTSLGKYFLYTSGVWVLGNTSGADESTPANPIQLVSWRPAHEELVLGAGGAVIRPGCVYGGKQSLLADWFAAAEQDRPLRIVGDGRNRWALIHLADLTDLYLTAISKHGTGMLHGIDDSRATLEESARAVAPNGSIEFVPLDAARQKLGPFADALAIDQVVASTHTRAQTGWSPSRTFIGSVDEQWREWRAAQNR